MRLRLWSALAVLSLGVGIIMVDATIVNVAVPSIMRDLHVTAENAEWVNSIYSMMFAALLITFGRLGDVHGRRLLFLLGASVFALASILAAASGNGTELVAARALQGIGGAMTLPASLSTVNATFTGRQRTVAFAVWGSTIAGTAAIGPVIGGWLTTDFSWRWAFAINVPLGLALIAGTLLFIRESKEPGARAGGDVVGMITSALGLAAVVFALIEGQQYGWGRPTAQFTVAGANWPLHQISPVLLAAILGVALLGIFVRRQAIRRAAGKPVILDLSLFGIRSFRNGVVAVSVVSLGEFGMIFALSLYLQNALAYSALHAGLTLLSLALGSFLVGPAAVVLSRRFGSTAVVRVGLGCEVSGIAWVGLVLGPGTSSWTLAAPLIVYGAGVGLAVAQLTSVVLADVPVAQSGIASGTQSTFRQVGSALGIAVLGAVLVAGLGYDTSHRLTAAGIPGAAAIAAQVKGSGGAAITGLRERPGDQAAVAAVQAGITDATRLVSFTASGFVLLGLLTTLTLRRRRDEAASVPEEAAPERARAATDKPGLR